MNNFISFINYTLRLLIEGNIILFPCTRNEKKRRKKGSPSLLAVWYLICTWLIVGERGVVSTFVIRFWNVFNGVGGAGNISTATWTTIIISFFIISNILSDWKFSSLFGTPRHSIKVSKHHRMVPLSQNWKTAPLLFFPCASFFPLFRPVRLYKFTRFELVQNLTRCRQGCFLK